LAAKDVADRLAPLRAIAEDAPETAGGGGTTLLASVPDPAAGMRAVPVALPALTEGGGGTTSCVPKSFPMTALTNEGLPAGGGGITAREAMALPLSR